MVHIQLLRNGYPDLKFFGNSFVALSLGREIPESLIVANHTEDSISLGDREHWKDFARAQMELRLEYVPFAAQAFGKEVGERTLQDLIEEEISSGEAATVDFHFPEREVNPRFVEVLPKQFGRSVKQFMHLHCSAQLWRRRGDYKDGDKKNRIFQGLRRAYDEGWVKKFIAVSYQVKDSFEEILPKDSIDVVQNGISEDLYTFREEPEKEAFRRQFKINGKFLIGYAGRLDPVKGYHDLIAILRWFERNKSLDVGFLIATSEGKNLDHFERDVRQAAPRLFAQGRVGTILDVAKLVGGVKQLNARTERYFLDHIKTNLRPRCDLYRGVSPVPLQAMVDIYVQPSELEAFGLSALEAVFTGTPVVAYRVGGLPEIISDHITGRLIDHSHKQGIRVRDFCDATVDLIEKRYGLNGEKDTTPLRSDMRDQLVENFSARVMAEKTHKIYES